MRLSPENIPLRRHLAESLLAQGRPELAEAEFRDALTLAPDDVHLKVGLANAFIQQGKNNLAVVILEALAKQSAAPPLAFVLYARLLASAGEVEEAVRQYHRGVERRPGRRRSRVCGADGDQLGEKSLRGNSTWNRVRSSRAGYGRRGRSPRRACRPRSTGRTSRSATSAGWSRVKEEIRIKIIHPLNHADLYKAYGKSIGGGILLYGPPGCGKTYLARATAGEIHAGFLAVGINDVLEMWIGNSERNLHALFDQARQNTPCVLFFDEVDALAASRADLRPAAGASSSISFWPSSTASTAAMKAS